MIRALILIAVAAVWFVVGYVLGSTDYGEED